MFRPILAMNIALLTGRATLLRRRDRDEAVALLQTGHSYGVET